MYTAQTFNIYVGWAGMQVRLENNDNEKQFDCIEVEDAYLGGRCNDCKRGRGIEGKILFIATVETDRQQHPQGIKLYKVKGFQNEGIKQSACHVLMPCLMQNASAKCTSLVEGKRRLNIRFSNGSHHSRQCEELPYWNILCFYSETCPPWYLAEFQYRFNHLFYPMGKP